jgi:hypothetical protein
MSIHPDKSVFNPLFGNLYVLFGLDGRNKQDVAQWLRSSCTVVGQFGQSARGQVQAGPNEGGQVLYDCQ